MKFKLLALSALLATCSIAKSQELRSGLIPALAPFYHGVASGDPLSDRVILWTRVTPDSTVNLGDSIFVKWRIATDTSMSNVVNSGSGYTDDFQDWTFKVDATGLLPDQCYYYDFEALNKYSIRGRTFTAPTGDVDSLRFAVVSCSNYEHGYFNAYRRLLQRNDFSVVLHLGDYIYEYEAGGYSAGIGGRDNEPTTEIISLDDYRVRHSHYKLDDDLRNLHQQYPFITIWDDHESANDAYFDGAENHDIATEGAWASRKMSSQQAYHEWMPIRSNPVNESIYRSFSFGDLVNFYMCDTRLEARTEQGVGSNDSTRRLLGNTQFNWLTNQLDSSTARWNVMGQQVMIAPLEIFGSAANEDQWDGYDWERNELMNYVVGSGVDNFVVLTGDIHTSWANDIPGSGYDSGTGAGSMGVEFVVTSVTSPGFPFSVSPSVIQWENDHMKYIELTEHGYMILDVNKQRAQADWYYVTDITSQSFSEFYGDGWYVNDGERFVQQASGFSQASPGYNCAYAPLLPLPVGLEEASDQIAVFGAYPNPFRDEFTVQYYLFQPAPVSLKVVNSTGQLVFSDEVEEATHGLNYMSLDARGLAAGTYHIIISTPEQSVAKTMVKGF